MLTGVMALLSPMGDMAIEQQTTTESVSPAGSVVFLSSIS